MNGEEKLQHVEELLDEYEKEIGLPPRISRECKYLEMTEEEIRNLTPESASEIGCVLDDFSVHLQRHMNKHAARAVWAEENIKLIVANESKNYNISYYEEKKYLIIANHELALRLHKIQTNSRLVMERLAFLPKRIENFSSKLDKLSFAKRKVNF